MDRTQQRTWLVMVVLIGAFYCTIGITFGFFAAWASSNRTVVAWRVASFVVSLVAFAIQIGYEHFRLRNRPLRNASHASMAVALGAFGLAVAANIHAIGVASANRRLIAAALVIWPVMTGIPAFLVALIAAGGLQFRTQSK